MSRVATRVQVPLGDLPAGGAFLPAGLQAVFFEDVAPQSSARALLTLVPTLSGVHALAGLSVLDAGGKIITSIRPVSIFVSS